MSNKYRTIGAGIFTRIFNKKNDRAIYREYKCCLDGECPLLAKGECLHISQFESCMYGGGVTEESKTPRAKSYKPWIAEREKRIEDFKKEGKVLPRNATNSLEFIGDYVWLPYAHTSMCEKVPFVRHSLFMVSGVPFLKREDFTIENIETLVLFRPHAIFGGEITDYQKKSVPMFLRALRTKVPDTYRELVEKHPEFVDRIPILSSITVPMHCIDAGVVEGYLVRGKYTPLEWDGEYLTVEGDFSVIGLDYASGDVVCKVKPLRSMMAKILDPAMVQALADKHPEYAK